MSNELNYPIKYAVLEVKENGEYVTSSDNLVKGYIVSKCYVVKSILDYLPNGNMTIKHQVVFPYKDITYFKENKCYNKLGYRNYPLYDVCGDPYPVNTVEFLYDTYDEAKLEADLKDTERLNKMLSLEGLSDKAIEIIQDNYELDKEECAEFEQAIFNETEDMEINDLEFNQKDDIKRIVKLMR